MSRGEAREVAACRHDAVRAYAPGRIEIAGNHTDHQGGHAIAATIDAGVEMILQPNALGRARVESEGFAPVDIDLTEHSPRADERKTTAALVRGMCALAAESGVPIGGFDAQVRSGLPAGGGLSSSAAFELALGRGIDLLFGDFRRPAAELAHMGQLCETRWFGKPCGLLDQSVIAVGGLVALDFAGARGPRVEPLDFDFPDAGLSVCLVESGADHRAGGDDYAQIPADMREVARAFGEDRLREVPEESFFTSLADLRGQVSDRALLRALHFYAEERLVERRRDALAKGDTRGFLEATRRSGTSSAECLQNLSRGGEEGQPMLLAYELVKSALHGSGACRVHGGGFGGFIEAFVPTASLGDFAERVESMLGKDCCHIVDIANEGACASWVE